LILLALFLTFSSFPMASSAPGEEIDITISRVCASYPGEFVTITNEGPTVNVKGWRLGDGEGSVTIGSDSFIPSGKSITWAAPGSCFRELYPDERCLPDGDGDLVAKGSLRLADAGDQVFLHDAFGNLRDMVCYGNIEAQPPWAGPPAMLKKGSVLNRCGPGTGPGSWEMGVPGLFSMNTPAFPVTARPIIYPENALPELVREIDRSRNDIRLATYLMENWTLARHLAGAAARGVNVTVMLEGQPVGGVSDNGAALAYYLQDAGVNVWTMRSSSSFRRYDYLHAKYAVFDSERLFVASENMADSSFNSNRGWAAIVKSLPLSASAMEVFDRDMCAKGVDVHTLESSIARSEGGPGRLLGVLPPEPSSSSASASLFTSPYGIQECLTSLLSSAQERILVEQMRIDEGWLESSPVLSALIEAAERGVSVRLLLDSGLGTEDGNRLVAGALNQRAIEYDLDLECRLTDVRSSFGRLHNKGLVVDDAVVVGSANWVDNSMLHNREMALLLRSEGICETYVQWFMEDWKGDAVPPTIELPWHYAELVYGEPVILDATGCNDLSGVANITWDLDGDGRFDLTGPVHAVTLREGEHNITLRVEDTLGNAATDTLTVMVEGGPEGAVPWLLYAPLPLVLSLLLLRRGRRL